MTEDLIKFWERCELQKPPYAHPDDLDILRRKGRWIDADATSFESYLAHSRFGPTDDHLHLSLLPVPYVGDVRNAEVVVLLLNPGFNYSEYWAEYKNQKFRQRLKQNLYQRLHGVEYPFFGLDPQFCWHGGFLWWEGKLRDVIQEIARVKFDRVYGHALRDLSRKLACVELIPYHSFSFRDHKLINHLPSVLKAKSFVSNTLIPEAVAGKRTLIVTRQAANWGIKEQANVIVYRGGHTRGASLSSKSEGGKAILKRYRILTDSLRPSPTGRFHG